MENDIAVLAKKSGIEIEGPLEINDLGLDYQVAIATDIHGVKWILRRPRRIEMFKQIQQEQRALEFLKTKLSVQIPDWQVVTKDLVAYPLIDYPPALAVDAKTFAATWNMKMDSDLYIHTLAQAISQLHSVSCDEAEAAGLKAYSVCDLRKNLVEEIKLVKNALGISPALESRWSAWVEEDSYWPDKTSVIHGDLYAGHTLVSSDGVVKGIIDWSEVAIADASADFSGHYMVFGEDSLKHLLSVYESLGGKTWPRMKDHIIERSAAASLKFAVFAVKTQNEDHLTEARRQLS